MPVVSQDIEELEGSVERAQGCSTRYEQGIAERASSRTVWASVPRLPMG